MFISILIATAKHYPQPVKISLHFINRNGKNVNESFSMFTIVIMKLTHSKLQD
jgi:hypothetical protein